MTSKLGKSLLNHYPDGRCKELHVVRLILDMLLGNENDLFSRYEKNIKRSTINSAQTYEENHDHDISQYFHEWRFTVSYVGKKICIGNASRRGSGLTSMLTWFAELGSMLLVCRKYCSEMSDENTSYTTTNNDTHFTATLDFLKAIDNKLSNIYNIIIKDDINHSLHQDEHKQTNAFTCSIHTPSQLILSPSQLIDSNSLDDNFFCSSYGSSSNFHNLNTESMNDSACPSYPYTMVKVKTVLTLYQVCRSWRQPAHALCIWVKQNIINIFLKSKEKNSNNMNNKIASEYSDTSTSDDNYTYFLLEKLELKVKLSNMVYSPMPNKNAFYSAQCLSNSTRAFFIMAYTHLFQAKCHSLFKHNNSNNKQNLLKETNNILELKNSKQLSSQSQSMKLIERMKSSYILTPSSSYVPSLVNASSRFNNVEPQGELVCDILQENIVNTINEFVTYHLSSPLISQDHKSITFIQKNLPLISASGLSGWTVASDETNLFLAVLHQTLLPFQDIAASYANNVSESSIGIGKMIMSSLSIYAHRRNRNCQNALHELINSHKNSSEEMLRDNNENEWRQPIREFAHPLNIIQKVASASYIECLKSQSLASMNNYSNIFTHNSPYIHTNLFPLRLLPGTEMIPTANAEPIDIAYIDTRNVSTVGTTDPICNNNDNNNNVSEIIADVINTQNNTIHSNIFKNNRNNIIDPDIHTSQNNVNKSSEITSDEIMKSVVEYFMPPSQIIKYSLISPIALCLKSLEYQYTYNMLFDQGHLLSTTHILYTIYCLGSEELFMNFTNTVTGESLLDKFEISDYILMWSGTALTADSNDSERQISHMKKHKLLRLIRRFNNVLTSKLQTITSGQDKSTNKYTNTLAVLHKDNPNLSHQTGHPPPQTCILASTDHFPNLMKIHNSNTSSTTHNNSTENISQVNCYALQLSKQIQIELKILFPVSLIINQSIMSVFSNWLQHLLPLHTLKLSLAHIWLLRMKQDKIKIRNESKLSIKKKDKSGFISDANNNINLQIRQYDLFLFTITNAVNKLSTHYFSYSNYNILLPLQDNLNIISNLNLQSKYMNSSIYYKLNLHEVQKIYKDAADNLSLLMNTCKYEVDDFVTKTFKAVDYIKQQECENINLSLEIIVTDKSKILKLLFHAYKALQALIDHVCRIKKSAQFDATYHDNKKLAILENLNHSLCDLHLQFIDPLEMSK